MKREVNEVSFTPEEVEKGMVKDLLDYLLTYNEKSDTHYNEIHITSDSYCTIVEYESVPYDHSYGGSFKYVDEEHEVLKEVVFPDNHFEYLPDDCEEDALKEWLEENPGYEKNDYGRWVYVGDEDELF